MADTDGQIGEEYFRVVESFFDRETSDGLPVVPPTEALVMAAVEAAGEDPDRSIGRVAPGYDEATVLKVAVNAVMAGCRPEYLPVVLAAVEAIIDPDFNLMGVQGTTHVCAPLIIVNGPIRKQIGMNWGHNCFGEGNRANATIGRALRLVMLNLGHGVPGKLDKSTFGHPGKYTFCVAEYEDRSAWAPLSVDRGFARGENVVTVFACEAPHSMSDHVNNTARGIARTFSDCVATVGMNNMYFPGEYLLAVGPEHAATFARDGWSKQDLRLFLFEHARKPMRFARSTGTYGKETEHLWPKWLSSAEGDDRVSVLREPSDLMIIVAGGEGGRFSVALPGWGSLSTSVSRRIRTREER